MDLRFKQLREAAGLKQKELADAIGEKVATYRTWEHGDRMCSLEQAARVADVLDCTLDELAGRTPPPAIEDPRLERIERAYRGMNETGRDALETNARALHALPENAGESGAVEEATA